MAPLVSGDEEPSLRKTLAKIETAVEFLFMDCSERIQNARFGNDVEERDSPKSDMIPPLLI